MILTIDLETPLEASRRLYKIAIDEAPISKIAIHMAGLKAQIDLPILRSDPPLVLWFVPIVFKDRPAESDEAIADPQPVFADIVISIIKPLHQI